MKSIKQVAHHLCIVIVNGWRVLLLCGKLSPTIVVFLIGLMLLNGLIPGVQIQVTRHLIGGAARVIQASGDPRLLMDTILWGAVQGSLSMLLLLLDVIQHYLQGVLQIKLASRMNLWIMEKALTLDIQHFEDDQLYDHLQRATSEGAYRPYQMFTQVMALGAGVVSLLSVVAILWTWNCLVAIVILLSPIPTAITQFIFARYRYTVEWGRSPAWRLLSYLMYLSTNVRSFKEIRLFGLGNLFLERYRERYNHFYQTDKGILKKQMLIMLPLNILQVAVIFGTQLYAIITTIIARQIGLLAGYLQAISIVQSNAQAMFGGLGQLYQNSLYMSNLFGFLNVAPSAITSGTRKIPKQLQKGIEFRHVSFCYPGTTNPVLRDLSFQLHANECVALIGHNGAGKTTIIKLLARLYEPGEGQILIDDVPIEEYDLLDLRQNTSVIFQDFVQYEMKVRDNIGFGYVTELNNLERIQQAAQESGAASVIAQLSQRYETGLGRMFEKGQELSIGQWQKIALARAFMRKAPIIVLDEPTASIDAAAEAEIFEKLPEITRGATSLLIAHRFSTVRYADRILVLEHGKIIEEGTHERLVQACGTYAHLFSLQAAGYL